jgi:predicted dehydrogenase
VSADVDTAADRWAIPHRVPVPPGDRTGIGVIGCGDIVRSGHLDGYRAHGLRVVGVYDIDPAATAGVREQFGVEQVFDSVEALLSDPDVEVVDVATGPGPRPALIRQALAAGKHVLSQKPFAMDVATARDLVRLADEAGVKLAVNQSGRYAPAWHVASKLIDRGDVGEVTSVTHVLDVSFAFTMTQSYLGLLWDYAIHWIDVSGYWLRAKQPEVVRARTYRVPHQPAAAQDPWGGWVELQYPDGSNALLRIVGATAGAMNHPFWIHGTEGTIRGRMMGRDFVEVEKDGAFHSVALEGDWWSVGFSGTMGELLTAITEDREPANSGRDNLRTVALTEAANRSADAGGAPVRVAEILES